MRISILSAILPLFVHLTTYSAPATIDNHIKIDQFGYRCNDQKIALVSNPQTGFNSGSPFSPGTGANQYQIRRWSDDFVAFTGTLVAWNSGATQSQSGDRVWWLDFSSLNTSGTYYVYDVLRNVGSYQFEIRDDIYKDVLKHAVRSYYYQRCGVAKTAAHAGAGWADASCHTGTQQDTDCRLYNNQVPGTSKNLSGGWHDAGDYNKYVNFTWGALTDLMLAYGENPTVWTDDYNIPESGNGIPDLLDEIKFELDWILKMQNANGSVLSIVGGGGASPPSADGTTRVYGPATTSASFTAASVLALGAIQFKSLGIPAMTAYATTLQTAAENAYNWAAANPGITFYNSGLVGAGEQEISAYDVTMRRLAAASFLYNLTATVAYKTYFESNYTTAHLIAWSFAYPFESTEQDVLLYYTKAAGATAAVVTNIRNAYSNSVSGGTDNLVAFTSNTDAYRAHLKDADYTWGSNSTKCKQACMFLTQNTYGLNAVNATNYTNAASGFLHYMHGTNPLAIVYLSNMNSYGSENSVNEFYHSWFYDGSALWDRVGVSTYGPAPGFVPGGPNPSWSLDGCCPGSCGTPAYNAQCVALAPPGSQPRQKSFKDWNASWPQNSWSVSENGIYYNASYIRLLSRFMATGTCGIMLGLDDLLSPDKDDNIMDNVSIYPNPFDHHTMLEITSLKKQKVSVRVFTTLGTEIMKSQEIYTNEAVEIGHQFPEGILILEIRDGENIRTHKLIHHR